MIVNFLEVGKSLPAKHPLGKPIAPQGRILARGSVLLASGQGGTLVLQLFDLARENAALKRELTHRSEDDKARRLLLAAIHKTWTGRTCASGESCGAAARLDALLHAIPFSCRDGGEYD